MKKMHPFIRPMKCVYTKKDENGKRMYKVYVVLGNTPGSIKKILEKIKKVPYNKSLSSLSSSEKKTLVGYYGKKWFEYFWLNDHINSNNAIEIRDDIQEEIVESTKGVSSIKELLDNESDASDDRENDASDDRENDASDDRDIQGFSYSMAESYEKTYVYDFSIHDDEVIRDVLKKICRMPDIGKKIVPRSVFAWYDSNGLKKYESLTHKWIDAVSGKTWDNTPRIPRDVDNPEFEFNKWTSTSFRETSDICAALDSDNYNLLFSDKRYDILWDMNIHCHEIFFSHLRSELAHESARNGNSREWKVFFNAYVSYYFPWITSDDYNSIKSNSHLEPKDKSREDMNLKIKCENYVTSTPRDGRVLGREKIREIKFTWKHGSFFSKEDFLIMFNNTTLTNNIPASQLLREGNSIKLYKPFFEKYSADIIEKWSKHKIKGVGVVFRISLDSKKEVWMRVTINEFDVDVRLIRRKFEKGCVSDLTQLVVMSMKLLIDKVNKTNTMNKLKYPRAEDLVSYFVESSLSLNYKNAYVDIGKFQNIVRLFHPWLRYRCSNKNGVLNLIYVKVKDFELPDNKKNRIISLFNSGIDETELKEKISREYFISLAEAGKCVHEVKKTLSGYKTQGNALYADKIQHINIYIRQNPIKITIKGAKNQRDLSKVYYIITSLLSEYDGIYIRKTDKRKEVREGLDNEMKSVKRFSDNLNVRKTKLKRNENLNTLVTMDPLRVQKGIYPRLCQAPFQPSALTEEQVLELGMKKNSGGDYEGQIEGKFRKTLALPKITEDKNAEGVVNYWVCKPSITGKYKHIGFHGTRKSDSCLPCCTLKPQSESVALHRKGIYDRCSGKADRQIVHGEDVLIKPVYSAMLRVLIVPSMRQNPGRLCVINGLFNKMVNFESSVSYGGQSGTDILQSSEYYYMIGTPFCKYSLDSFLFATAYALQITVSDIKKRIKLDHATIRDYVCDIITEFCVSITILDEKVNGNYVMQPTPFFAHSYWHFAEKHIIMVRRFNDTYYHYNPICCVSKAIGKDKLDIHRVFSLKNNAFNRVRNWAHGNELVDMALSKDQIFLKKKNYLFGLSIVNILYHKYDIQVKGQISTRGNKCVYIVLEDNTILPVFPSPCIKHALKFGGKTVHIKTFPYADINKYVKYAEDTVKSYKELIPARILELWGDWVLIVDENGKPCSIGSDFNLTVPIKSRESSKRNFNRIVQRNSTEGIEELISENRIVENSILKRGWFDHESETLFYMHLSEAISKSSKTKAEILSLLDNTDITYDKKFSIIYGIFTRLDSFLKTIPKIVFRVDDYVKRNERILCQRITSKNSCGDSQHCIWHNKKCLLTVLEKNKNIFLKKGVAGLLEDTLFRNELLQEKTYHIKNVIDYSHVNLKRGEMYLDSAISSEYIRRKVRRMKFSNIVTEDNTKSYIRNVELNERDVREVNIENDGGERCISKIFNSKNIRRIGKYIIENTMESDRDPLFTTLARAMYEYEYLPYWKNRKELILPRNSVESWSIFLKNIVTLELKKERVNKDILDYLVLGTRLTWINEEKQLKLISARLRRPIEIWRLSESGKLTMYTRIPKNCKKTIPPYRIGGRFTNSIVIHFSLYEA